MKYEIYVTGKKAFETGGKYLIG